LRGHADHRRRGADRRRTHHLAGKPPAVLAATRPVHRRRRTLNLRNPAVNKGVPLMLFRKLLALSMGAALTVTMTACGSSPGSTSNAQGQPVVTIMVGGLDKQIYLP